MSSTATAPPAVATQSAGPGELTHRQILTVLSGLMLGMFLAALDQTIVSTSITTIANDLRGLDLQAWATTAYLITSTISTPLYGKLSDQYGRKPFFLFAISIFVLGSIACSFSTSMYMLAAFRAVQGIGAGGLMSLALAIIGDIVPPRQRAKYQGYLLAVFGTSSVAGPVLGGALAGTAHIWFTAGWRWVFLINVPIGIVALFVVTKVLKGRVGGGVRHRLDLLGALTLMVGLVPLLIVAEQGRNWGWGSVAAVLCYVIAVLGLISFVVVERRMAGDALIPLTLFRSGVFRIVNAGGLLVGLAMFGAISMIPQFLQIVRGATPTESGLLLLPFVGGMMVFSIVSGQITARTGRYKFLPVVGTALMVVASLLFFFRLSADMPLWETDLYMVLFGAGLGLCMQTLSLAAQNAVPARDMGVATSTSTSFRQLGGTLGVAVFFSLLFSTVSGNIRDAITNARHTTAFQSAIHDPTVLGNPVNKPVVNLLSSGGAGSDSSGVLQNASFLRHIDHRLAHPFFVGFAQSMTIVFLCAAAVAFVAFLLFLVMKEVPLRQYSGLQEAAMAEAATAVAGPVAEPPTGGQHSLTSPNGHRVRTGDLGTQFTASGWIRGRVRRPDGSAVPDATLTLIDPSGRQVGRATAATDGAYHIDTPSAGTYVLLTSADSHQPQAASVLVGNNPVDTDVVLAGTASLIGTVTEAGSSAPVPGATTTLADGCGEVVGSQTTDANGGYRFPDLVAGNYTLVVSAPSHRPSARTVPVPATGQAREDIDLAGSVTLYGVARAKDTDHPVADARITLLDTARNIVGVTDTDDAGRYRFDNLPEGDYTLIASGYPPTAGTLRMLDGTHAQHDIELGHPRG